MAAEILDSHVHLLDPVGLTYPWLGDLTIGQQPCDAARFAADASSVTGAIVVEAGVAPGKACPPRWRPWSPASTRGPRSSTWSTCTRTRTAP